MMDKEQPEFVECYMCNDGQNYVCGYGKIDCQLCKKYGDGKGNLLKEYRHQNVTIEYIDHKGKLVNKTYKAPKYDCLMCKDKKKTCYIISESLFFENCAYSGETILPCHKCRNLKHHEERVKAIEYISKEYANWLPKQEYDKKKNASKNKI